MSVSTRKRQKKNRKNAAGIDGMPSRIPVTITIRPPRYFAYKEVVERLVAAILFVPGMLVVLLAAILVRLTSPGWPIFCQYRVGKNGQVFKMYKIRTMIDGAEEGTGPTWTKPHDPRVTPLGRLLRKLHIDEFPQLINVLRGEMSLIGPRPERPEFVAELINIIPEYSNRLAVMPGVTGLAQINLPPDSTIDDVRRKLVLDLKYINQAGLLLDLRMFFCTFLRLLGCPGFVAMRLFALHREVPEFPPVQPAPAELSGGNGALSPQKAEAASLQDVSVRAVTPANGNGSQQKAEAAQLKPQIIASPKPR